MIWTWEMQLAAGGQSRLAAEQPHHGPMFEYTGVPYEGISLSMISHLAKPKMVKSGRKRAKKKDKWGKHVAQYAQPPLIKHDRHVSVWISTINYRTVTQCTGHQHHCHPGDAAPDANWISHHDKTSQSRCHIIWCRCHGVRQPGAGASALLRTPSLLLFVAWLRHRFIMNTRAVNEPSRSFTVPVEAIHCVIMSHWHPNFMST